MKNYLFMLEQEGILYSLQTIYVGMKIKLLITRDLAYYVNQKLLIDDEYNKPFIQLIVEEYSYLGLVHCMNQLCIPIPIEGDNNWQIAVRTLRYAYLTNLILSLEKYSKEILLEKVAEFYEDMHCPQDMEFFIYYMPPTNDYDPSQYSIEDNRSRLITMLKEFLVREKLFIKSNTVAI